MKLFLQRLSLLTAMLAILGTHAFAGDANNNPAQLDTTPPAPEGALTTDQTPPISLDNTSTSGTPAGGAIGVGGSIGAPLPDKSSAPLH